MPIVHSGGLPPRLVRRRDPPPPPRHRSVPCHLGTWARVMESQPSTPLRVPDDRSAELWIVRQVSVVCGAAEERHKAQPLLSSDCEPEVTAEHVLVAAEL